MKRYWAGYSDGKIYFANMGPEVVACIYKTKREASKYFEDVRPVFIREIASEERTMKGVEG